jgi:prepilin-type N-terminal cleavage/methylation domain-containing protein
LAKVKRYKGVSLIELLVVIAIMGILMSVAVPSYKAIIQSNYRSLAQQSLVSCASTLMEERTRLGSWNSLIQTLSEEEKDQLCIGQVPKEGNIQYYLIVKLMASGFELTAQPESIPAKADGKLTLVTSGLGCRITAGISCEPW